MSKKWLQYQTVKVWPGDRDIRLIKLVAGNSQERIICRVFDWKNSKNSETFCRVAPGGEAEAEFDLPSIDTIIEQMQEYTPQLEIIGNKELVTFYRERPLDCFMPDYVLSRTRPMDVENWVCNQFYRKGGENSERFEYTNFVSAKKIVFSFGENKKEQRDINMKSFEIETWHVEIKRQVGWALQLPIGIYEFFSGMFLAGAQYPSEVDKKAMERLVQGVPMIDEERNKTVDDFAMELGACSTINFYMACDRSESQLEINGRIWVRSFGSAGRGIRSVLGNTVGRAANLLGAMRLEDVNRRLENVARLGENANRAVRAWEAVRGNPPPQENPQAN
ncbi:hypothetical protein [Candidatus Rhabdochlamydia sp. T3358]|uniref:hypothetical protein n=1 Tax=Candidatus Rhabdochlamydia sp. T3358 TaxID=2099795 RepID=UPI0010B9F67D|nr:hypothetical protein [Candidatus Rhabdochlamydia sp. T3358]VHO03142.1 hypothetical protein RHT_00757 [Candidatus Rhabdochlamydia sp. T3358]